MDNYIKNLNIDYTKLSDGDTDQVALASQYVLKDDALTDSQKVQYLKDIMVTASYAYFD